MPIYEYYCPTCDGRFSHLARRFGESPPPCPGCGSCDVEKMVSRVNLGRSETQRRADYGARSRQVDRDDPREMARFLQQAGELADEEAVVDKDAFREVVARRAEGASDEDLQDVVDAIALPSREEMERVHDEAHHRDHHEHDHRHQHDHGCACGESHDSASGKGASPRQAQDLGWA